MTRTAESSIVVVPDQLHGQVDVPPIDASSIGAVDPDTEIRDVTDLSVDIQALSDYSARLDDWMPHIRKSMVAPDSRKTPPTFTASQVAEMCGINRHRLNYLLRRAPDGQELPQGDAQGNGRTRVYKLDETRELVRSLSTHFRPSPLTHGRPAQGKTIMIGQLKGGSTKTTTALCLAQGLSLLRGRKVLLIDLDPQASLSELLGFYADSVITDQDTVYPLIQSHGQADLKEVIRSSYWDGIDSIVSHPSLFAAEFVIPAALLNNPDFAFWDLLRKGLEPLKSEYDYIILDTAPSLSYLTFNAMMAADSIVMPLVPESLDFISSVSFWKLFSELTDTLALRGVTKSFDFISVLLSKVQKGPQQASNVVRAWAEHAYGNWLSKIEIPESSVMSAGSLKFSTVFDISRWDGSTKSLSRIRDPFEDFSRWIDDQVSMKWKDLV